MKYLVKDKDRHGNIRCYVRFNGRKTRLRADEGEAFDEEYRAALERLKTGPAPDGQAYIYFVAEDTDRIKIGISKNPRDRMSSLKTGSSRPLKFARIFRTESELLARKIEKFLHRAFKDRRVSGEWFAVPVEEVETLLLETAKRNGTLLFSIPI